LETKIHNLEYQLQESELSHSKTQQALKDARLKMHTNAGQKGDELSTVYAQLGTLQEEHEELQKLIVEERKKIIELEEARDTALNKTEEMKLELLLSQVRDNNIINIQ
jgi:predicted  nucleic acid-binding Zn-ribbon protein